MKRNPSVLAGSVAALCLAGASGSARAVLIDVDFNGPNPSGPGVNTQTGAAATGTIGDVWNGVGGGSGTGVGLNNSVGLPSGATLDFTSLATADVGGATQIPPDPSLSSTFSPLSPVYPLMRDLLASAGIGDVESVTLHNLPAGNYDLYVYSNSNINNNFAAVQTRVTTFVANGITGTVGPNNYPYVGSDQDPNSPPGTLNHDVLALGKNYNIIPVTVTSSGNLLVTYTNLQTDSMVSDTVGQFNGFQLQSVPEPTSMGLLCFGATGLLAARRRRSLSV